MIELKAELLKKKKEYEEAKKMRSNLKESKKQSKDEPIKIEQKDHVTARKNLTEEEFKRSREALEAKSRLYHKLERGKLMETDLNKGQRENLMVDFAWKGWNPEKEDFDFDFSSSDEEDEDHNEAEKGKLKFDQVLDLINRNEDSDDRWIEYEDEFGRTRVSKLGQIRQIQKERDEINNRLRLRSESTHYDGDAEIRNKGVGFYQFARDEEGRRRQMDELKRLREETVEKRMRTLLRKEQRRLRIEQRLRARKISQIENESVENEVNKDVDNNKEY